VKHVNTRFPDDLYDEVAEAANAEERPIGSWLRIAAKEKLARSGMISPDIDTSNTGHGWVRPRADGSKPRCGGPSICPVCAREAASLSRGETSPNFKKGGKK
jgi:hypothetical protein